MLANKRRGDVLAAAVAVMVTLLLTRLRANDGAIRAQEPNVCLGMACERNNGVDAEDCVDALVTVAIIVLATLLLCC